MDIRGHHHLLAVQVIPGGHSGMKLADDFSSELRDLIDKWRDQPGYALADIVDELETAAESLADLERRHGIRAQQLVPAQTNLGDRVDANHPALESSRD